jgi:hypothetical protein
MVERIIFIGGYDQATWTTSTQDLRVDNGPLAVDTILVSPDVANTSATATTVANLLAGLNPFKVTHEAKKITEIRGDDLYALDLLCFGFNPFTVVASTATSDVTRVNALRVPVQSVAGATVSCLATKAAITNGGTERLSLGAICEQSAESFHYEILTTSYTASGAGTYMQAFDKIVEGDVVGFLIFSTTIPTASADTISADKIRIKVNGNVVKDTNWDLAKGNGMIGHHDLLASPGDASIIDNYVFIPFLKESPNKGDKVSVEINAGDTNAIRIVEVIKVAN